MNNAENSVRNDIEIVTQAELVAALAVVTSFYENKDVTLRLTDESWKVDGLNRPETMVITVDAMLSFLKKNPHASDEELKEAEDEAIKSHEWYEKEGGTYVFYQSWNTRSIEATKELSDILKRNYPKIREIAVRMEAAGDAPNEITVLRSEIE